MREYGYLEKMLDILTDPYTHRDLQNVRKNRKLETNIGKLFSLLADGFEVIHKNAELVRLWDDLENAEGAVLDRYGANFGVQRGAASDALYRILIRVKMLAQLSGGDGDTVIRAAGELLGVQFSDIELQDVYPAKVALYVDQSLLSEERLALIDQIAVALKRILTAGVGLRLYLRTYRTYRYDLNIGHGAMVNVVRWLPPVSQDRSSRADFKIGHGGFTEADFYPPIVGKDRLFESRFETSRGTYLPPVIEGVYPDTVQINSANVDKGFYCTAVVLYAEDPDEGEVPYTYLVLENEPEWIRPASSIVGKLATIDLIAAVGDVDTVTAAIDPEAIATVAAVNDLLQRHNEDPEAHAGIIMDAVGSAMKKLEESGQIMDQKTVETMIRKEIAEHGSGGYYGTYFLTLAASGWEQADEESPDYSYIYTAELPDSTSALIPSGAPLLGSFHIAEDAGVVNGCETGDGVVKFYSKEVPAADISTCIILFGKGGGGESDLTVATREQLGHVKIGNGIEVTEDGTISANAKVSEDQIATSDDTSEMLKEIYGE